MLTMTDNKKHDVLDPFEEAYRIEREEEETEAAETKRPVQREMTQSFVTRVWTRFLRLVGKDVKDRTFRALLPRIKDLHELGIRSEELAQIIAYEYDMHSKFKRQIEELETALAQGRKAAPVAPTHGFKIRRSGSGGAAATRTEGGADDKDERFNK